MNSVPIHSSSASPELRVGIVGLGAMGRALAQSLDAGLPGLRLSAVSVRKAADALDFVHALRSRPPIVPLAAMAAAADVVVECAGVQAVPDIATAVLGAGGHLVVASVAALLEHPGLVDLARQGGGRISVPSGAVPGLDALVAAAEGQIHSVRLVTRKPVAGLLGAPWLVANGIDIAELTSPCKVFEGSARDAARAFPANINVAAALALAGVGADRTQVEIWADPACTRNSHQVMVESDAASFTLSIEAMPSTNPRTSRIATQSVLALLRKLAAPLRVGT